MELIDIGANLTNSAFRDDLDDVLERAREAGVARVVVTGTSEAESAEALALARTRPDMLSATAGVHPHHAKEFGPDTLTALRSLAAEDAVVAVGETGLDFNRNYSPPADQERCFIAQLELAAETGLPVFIHQRDAHPRLLAILKEFRDHLSDAVVHCFTDTRDALWDYLDLDLHIGVTGWICDERRGLGLREIVGDIPATRLMVETDAPYLLPRDLKPKPQGRRNEPFHLAHIVTAVANCRGEPAEELARATTETAKRFFRLDD